MSQTYSIACKDCKKALWIAQGSYSVKERGHVYTTQAHSKALFAFFIAHEKHHLIFGVNVEEPIIDYDEIEIDSKYSGDEQ